MRAAWQRARAGVWGLVRDWIDTAYVCRMRRMPCARAVTTKNRPPVWPARPNHPATPAVPPCRTACRTLNHRTDDKWHHLAVTWQYDTGAAALYLDGEPRVAFFRSDYGVTEQRSPTEGGVAAVVAARTSRDGSGALALGQVGTGGGGCNYGWESGAGCTFGGSSKPQEPLAVSSFIWHAAPRNIPCHARALVSFKAHVRGLRAGWVEGCFHQSRQGPPQTGSGASCASNTHGCTLSLPTRAQGCATQSLPPRTKTAWAAASVWGTPSTGPWLWCGCGTECSHRPRWGGRGGAAAREGRRRGGREEGRRFEGAWGG